MPQQRMYVYEAKRPHSVHPNVSGKQRRKKIKKAASQPKERSEPGRRGSPVGKAVENQKSKKR